MGEEKPGESVRGKVFGNQFRMRYRSPGKAAKDPFTGVYQVSRVVDDDRRARAVSMWVGCYSSRTQYNYKCFYPFRCQVAGWSWLKPTLTGEP